MRQEAGGATASAIYKTLTFDSWENGNDWDWIHRGTAKDVRAHLNMGCEQGLDFSSFEPSQNTHPEKWCQDSRGLLLLDLNLIVFVLAKSAMDVRG